MSSPNRPHRKKGGLPMWVVALVLLALSGAGAGGYWYANQPKNGVHVKQLEADAAAKLPPGTDKEQVFEWFKSHGVTDIGDLTDVGGGKVGIRGLMPNDTYLGKAEIDISFWYDKNGKITKSHFQRVAAH
jgi:hypothetical protein